MKRKAIYQRREKLSRVLSRPTARNASSSKTPSKRARACTRSRRNATSPRGIGRSARKSRWTRPPAVAGYVFDRFALRVARGEGLELLEALAYVHELADADPRVDAYGHVDEKKSATS
jgi:hypothetical protein